MAHWYLELLQWLRTHFPGTNYGSAIDFSTAIGDLVALKWLYELRYIRRSMEIPLTAHHEHLIQEFFDDFTRTHRMHLLENGCWIQHHTMVISILCSGCMKMIVEIIRLTHWTELLVNCNVNVVLYLLGTEMKDFQVIRAQLSMLKSSFMIRPELVRICSGRLARVAIREDLIEILEWVKQFGFELRSTALIIDTVLRNDVTLLQWFYQNRYKVWEPEFHTFPIKHSQLDAVHWFLNHGCTIKPLNLSDLQSNDENVMISRQ
ncbi:hypothetical protein PHMEG_0006706 [Phytophthora megakarya]|uniref:Uncharacterized protein n=1 Tax=Phytophthora megakarya TaxID=4795 RepID=A0A225WN85_9STRA|nr:hypothetical protein PHMEG_0006706 [Phytophthora megakarya]